jgi:hypothetical protein
MMDDEHRVHLEQQYWQACALDPEVDVKYIADVDTKACVDLVVANMTPLLQEGRRILDLGCGVGRITLPLKERFPKADLMGLDISWINAHPDHRGEGIATAMYGVGRTMARVKPRHSNDRTEDGDVWAPKSAARYGGPVPRNVNKQKLLHG